MKKMFLLGALFAGCAFAASADGYTDGIDYYKAGQYNNAQTVLTSTINDPGTDKALSYYYLGQISMIDGNVNQAKDYFSKGLSANPENPYNYVGMGYVDLKSGNKNAANDNFKKAQSLAKKNYEITVDIARAYYDTDPVAYAKEVQKYIDEAHKKSKNTEPSIYILEGDMLFDQKKLGEAAAKYEMAIRYEEDNPEGYVKFSRAYMVVNPQFSIDKLIELNEKQPSSALAQRELAERYYENNQWTKAAEQYGKYMSNPNHFPEDKARYLVLLYAGEEYPKVVETANELLAVQPNNAQALRVKMLSQKELKDYQNAKATAEKFFALKFDDPTKAPFNQADYTAYGVILDGLNDTIGAINAYEKAVAMDPTKADAYRTLSTAYNNAEMYAKAADALERGIATAADIADSDYMTLSGRWLNAANSATDPEEVAALATKGINAIDTFLGKAEKVYPNHLQRKAILLLIRDNKQATPEVGEAFLALKNALDEDSARETPLIAANTANSWYKTAYQILFLYYQNQGDKEQSDEMYNKLQELLAQ